MKMKYIVLSIIKAVKYCISYSNIFLKKSMKIERNGSQFEYKAP